MKINKKSGITLIALVITIIVLLILAGVSISMLTGNNSILKQAGRARDINEEKGISERVQLAYLSAVVDSEGNVTEEKLKEELKKEFGENGYKLSKDLTKVTIDGKEYDIEGTIKEETKEKIIKDKNGTIISKIEGVTEPWLPTSTAEITNNDLSTGLTIKDANQNEWVWIEVPMNVTSGKENDTDIETALRDYTDTVVTRPEGWSDTYLEGKGLSNQEYEDKKTAMLQSIKTNGGFYIGKYETGNEGGTLNKTYYDKNDNLVENPENGYEYYDGVWNGGRPVIKQNAFPYNWVTNEEAENLSEELKTGEKNASLMFGIQWDLILKYLKEKGGLSANDLTSNSKEWGNYYNTKYNIANTNSWYSKNYGDIWMQGGYNKTQDEEILLTAGSHTQFAKKNIFDLAGNLCEWTLEKTSSIEHPCSSRGGDYLCEGDDFPVSDYSDYGIAHSGDYIGFRVTLY